MAVKRTGLLVAALLLGSLAIPAFGQAAPPGGAGAGGQGGRGNFNPAQMQQRMLDRIKQAMGSSDDEFAALSPKIEKVMTAQRDAQSRGGFGGGGRQRGGGNNPAATAAPAQPTTAVQTAAADLQTTLDNKDSKPEDIKAKLTALRDAKAAAKAELVKAQTDLREVITVRQEAVLVTMGYLD